MSRPLRDCLALLCVGGWLWYVYTPYYNAYDPEQVCENQAELTREVCHAHISLARSAGW